MSHLKKWKVLDKFRIRNQESGIKDLVKTLLSNRGLKTKKEIQEFLDPPNPDILTPIPLGIKKDQLQKAVGRINKATKDREQIIVYGDYDVDGICGTAILWETLNSLGAKAMPYIPHRVEEGYGLSVKGIQNVILNLFQDLNQTKMPKQVRHDKKGLIITVDNGIVANEAVEFANKQGIDIIITDHHVPSKRLPKAHAVVHTTKLCGAGVAWVLSQAIENRKLKIENSNGKWKVENGKLELVALATIADLVPLVGANRTLTKFGLEKLRATKRVGLLELFREATLDPSKIGVYEVGHIIAPRLNAMGRIEHAMDSLRLLCTKDPVRAKSLADKLGRTNRERQLITEETTLHAISNFKFQISNFKKLIFVSHESYQQGVIGLVAGKLVEEFYRPAIVVSKGETYSKASARSVHGFNMIEFIRSASELLIDAGGHPMAAGFTVESTKLELLQQTLERKAEKLLNDETLTKVLRIDCELPLGLIDKKLYDEMQKLAPFGMGNPQPLFVSRGVTIEDMRLVGNDGRHLKFRLSCHPELVSGSRDSDLRQNDIVFDAIAFGMGGRASEFHIGDTVDIVYTIEQNEWNGNKKLQLKIKDIK